MPGKNDVVEDVDDDIPDTTVRRKQEPEPKPRPKKEDDEPVKPQLPARLIRDAQELGIDDNEINACTTAGELRELITDERARVQHAVAVRSASSQKRDERVEPEVKPTPAEDAEEEIADYQFENKEFIEGLDPAFQKELKGLFKSAVKAARDGSMKKLKAIQEKYEAALEEAKSEIAGLKGANSPESQEATQALASYPTLFGKSGVPKTEKEKTRYKMLNDYLFGPDGKGGIKAEGKFKGRKPSVIIAEAVDVLWGVGPTGNDDDDDGDDDEPEYTRRNPNPRKRRKADDWADAGQAAPDSRNGKSGVPGGDRAAKAKINGVLRKQGRPVIDDDDDDDLDDDM